MGCSQHDTRCSSFQRAHVPGVSCAVNCVQAKNSPSAVTRSPLLTPEHSAVTVMRVPCVTVAALACLLLSSGTRSLSHLPSCLLTVEEAALGMRLLCSALLWPR